MFDDVCILYWNLETLFISRRAVNFKVMPRFIWWILWLTFNKSQLGSSDQLPHFWNFVTPRNDCSRHVWFCQRSGTPRPIWADRGDVDYDLVSRQSFSPWKKRGCANKCAATFTNNETNSMGKVRFEFPALLKIQLVKATQQLLHWMPLRCSFAIASFVLLVALLLAWGRCQQRHAFSLHMRHSGIPSNQSLKFRKKDCGCFW